MQNGFVESFNGRLLPYGEKRLLLRPIDGFDKQSRQERGRIHRSRRSMGRYALEARRLLGVLAGSMVKYCNRRQSHY